MAEKNQKSILNISKGLTIIFIGTIIGNIIGLLTQVLFGRFLGPQNYGLYNLALSLIMIIGSLINLGTAAGLIQYIPHNLAQKKYIHIKEAVNFSLLLPAVLGISSASLLFIFSDQIAFLIFNNLELGLVLKIISIALPFWSLHNIGISIMQSFKKPNFFVYIENIFMPITKLLTFLIISYIGYSLFGAIIGFILASIFAFILYLYIYRSKLISNFDDQVDSEDINKISVPKELLSISLPLFLASLSIVFISYTDKILLGIYTNPVEVGIYTASFTIASTILFIFSAFSFNFRPLFAEYFALKKFNEIRNVYSHVTKWIFFITFPLILYLSMYSEDIIRLIYGNSFTQGALSLSILSLGIGINGLTGLSGETLVSIRKSGLNLASEIVGLISNIILNLFFIPFLGIVGAAIATSISIFLRNATSLFFVYKNLNFNPYNINYLKILFCSFFSIILTSKLLNFITDIEWVFLIILPLSLVFYTLLLFLTKSFDNFDKVVINNIINFIKQFLSG